MDLKEYLKEDEQINEGIVFFKNSKRLNKLARKLRRNSAGDQNILDLSQKIEETAEVFKEIEQEYKDASSARDRQKVKVKYEQAKEKYFDLIKIINRESTLKALKVAGGLAIAGVTLLMLYNGISRFTYVMGLPIAKEVAGTEATIKGLSAAASQTSGIDLSSALNQEAARLSTAEAAKLGALQAERDVLKGNVLKAARFGALSTIGVRLFGAATDNLTKKTKEAFKKLEKEAK